MSQEPESRQGRLYTDPRVLVLSVDALLVQLGFGVIAPSMAFYLIALEGGLTEPPGPGYVVPAETVAQFAVILGIMMAAFMGTRTLLARYWGNASDTRGRKPIILTGLFGYVLLLVLFGLAQNWIQLVLIRCLQGVVSAMVWPVTQAALMDIVGPERRGEGLGFYTTVSNLGFILGPGLGGLLYNFCRDYLLLAVPDVFRVPYYIGALITLPAAILTIVVLRETCPGKLCLPTNVPQETVAVPTEGGADLGPRVTRMIHALYLMAVMDGLAMGLGQPIFQLFLMSKITSDIGLIGLVISGAGAVGMLFSIPSGRWADRHGRKSLAIWGAVSARGSLFVLPFTRSLAQTSFVWVAQAASMSVSQPALMALQADLVPWKLRGKLFGTLQAFMNGGATIGPILGGWLYSVFSLVILIAGPLSVEGVVVPFWLASGLGFIGIEALRRYVSETKPSQ